MIFATGTSHFCFFYRLNGFNDFVLISDDCNHLLLHLFVQTVVSFTNLYIFGVFLNQHKYFLDNAIVDGVDFYFIRVFTILLRINCLQFFINLSFKFQQVISVNIVFQNAELLLNYNTLRIIDRFYTRNCFCAAYHQFSSFSIRLSLWFWPHTAYGFIIINIIFFLVDLFKADFDLLIDGLKVHRLFFNHLQLCCMDEFLYNLVADINAVFRFQSFLEQIQSIERLWIFLNLQLFLYSFAD